MNWNIWDKLSENTIWLCLSKHDVIYAIAQIIKHWKKRSTLIWLQTLTSLIHHPSYSVILICLKVCSLKAKFPFVHRQNFHCGLRELVFTITCLFLTAAHCAGLTLSTWILFLSFRYLVKFTLYFYGWWQQYLLLRRDEQSCPFLQPRAQVTWQPHGLAMCEPGEESLYIPLLLERTNMCPTPAFPSHCCWGWGSSTMRTHEEQRCLEGQQTSWWLCSCLQALAFVVERRSRRLNCNRKNTPSFAKFCL